MKLRKALDKIKRKASGYILAYDPRGKTEYACRAWFAEHGPWFHGYGTSEEEAAEDCLMKLKAWWDVRDKVNVGDGLSRRREKDGKETEEKTDTEEETRIT